MIERPIERLKKDRDFLVAEIDKSEKAIVHYQARIDSAKKHIEQAEERVREYDEVLYFLDKLDLKEGEHGKK